MRGNVLGIEPPTFNPKQNSPSLNQPKLVDQLHATPHIPEPKFVRKEIRSHFSKVDERVRRLRRT